GEVEALADVRVVIDCLFVLVIKAQSGNRRAKHFHWSCCAWECLEKLEDLGRKVAGIGEFFLEGFEFGCGGELPVPEEIGRFLKRRVIRQIVNVDPAVCKHSGITINPANTRVSCDNSLQTL